MDIPKNLKYSDSHEWVKVTGDTATIGITDYAQDHLGDIVYVELPEIGSEVDADQPCSVVESVKAAEDMLSPVSGEVLEVNDLLENAPETVNKDPYGDGWIFKVRLSDPDEVEDLMDAEEYEEFLEEEE